MAVSFYKGNQFRILAGKKIYQNNAWKSLPNNAKMYLNGAWHFISGRAATAYLIHINGDAVPLMPVDQAAMGEWSIHGDEYYFVHAGNLYKYSNGTVSSTVLTNVTSLIGSKIVLGGEVYGLGGNLSIDSRYGSGWSAFDDWGCCGIKNGDLYDSAGNLMLSDVSHWQTGYVSGNQHTFDSYAITNGRLYYYWFSPVLNNNGNETGIYRGNVSSQVGISSSWTAISRHRSSDTFFTYGINGGVLYKLQRSAGVIDSSGTWTAVDGYAFSSGNSYCRGVRDGKLCQVSTDGTVTVMDYRTGWTFYTETFAICEGKLYNISGNTPVQIGSWSDWIDVCVTKYQYGTSATVALRRTAV